LRSTQPNLSVDFSQILVEEKRMSSFVSKSLSRVLALAFVALMSVALAAQDSAKPVAKAAPEDSATKWDIFAGYSYIAPHGNIVTPLGGANLSVPYSAITPGGIVSVARYFNRYVGIEGIGDVHLENEAQNPWVTSKDDISGGAVGLIWRYPTADITPFVHALIGADYVGGPYFQADKWGAALTAGGGMDYHTPLFNHRLSIRIFQADYEYTHENFGTGTFGGRANINAARLSAGIVIGIGNIAPPPPVTLSCSASPALVFPGDPVTVTATAGDLNPKLTAVYTWTGDGVTGSGTTATVATGSLAAGSYTVKGNVKEGPKPGQTADCSASFTVKAYEPPTISCSASPSTINPGDSSTVTSVGVSPQNRPLTYSYMASAGTITGSGTTAAFSSAGAPTGAIGITCNVTDDKGQTASAGTSVTITAPYVKPIPHASALCSISFDKDKARPTRVDNEAKACLDQVALDLQNQADAKAVVVGESTAAEKEPKKGKHAIQVDFAGERAVNTKEYLVTDKGIDASRIIVKTGTTDGKTVEDYLVPSGATFETDVQGTTAVDETMVKPVTRKPLGEKPHHHKKAAPAAQ
jgi:hypothetical protein